MLIDDGMILFISISVQKGVIIKDKNKKTSLSTHC